MAGCHAAAPTAQATDWPRIARLYQHLADMTGSPVVELNRAVARPWPTAPRQGWRCYTAWRRMAPSPATTCCLRPRPTSRAAPAERGSRQRLRGGGSLCRHRPRAPVPERTAGQKSRSQHTRTRPDGQCRPAAREPAIPGQSRVPSTSATCYPTAFGTYNARRRAAKTACRQMICALGSRNLRTSRHENNRR